MNKSSFLLLLSLLFFSGLAHSDNAEFIAFARANADRFKDEIVGDRGIGLGTTTTVRGKISPADFDYYFVAYDPDNGEMVIGSTPPDADRFFFTDIWSAGKLVCKPTGTFLGQTAYGAKVTVRRETCDRFIVENTIRGSSGLFGVLFKGTKIKMSPAQFRAIKKNGITAEYDLTVGRADNQPVVGLESTISNPTSSDPYQTTMNVWTISGIFEEIRWVLPLGGGMTRVWSRQP